LIMPRIGTLWSVPLQRSAAQTGVSDSMSPGDFANLTRSGKLAFRVSFEGEMPPRSELYWRGLVFELFDGRTWTQSQRWLYQDGRAVDWALAKPSQWRRELENLARNREDESLWRYDIVMEPTQQSWPYGLAMPLDIPPEAGLTRVFSLMSKSPVRQRHRYKGVSVRNYVLERELSDWQRVRQLQLPQGFNPETRETAERWRRESQSNQALIDRLLQHYNDTFTYTLSPPALGRNTVDEFLWGTQQGFCEHFASSFVFFMRAAGIPARVVGGYQGGELSPAGDYLLVHQFDAHAWAEVWLEGRGWVRVDPTASVAPERIEYGLNDALTDEDSQLLADPLSLVYYRNISLLNSLRLSWDSLNYYWYQSVIGYDDDKQENFFREWLGGLEPWRLASVLIGGAAIVLGLISLSAWLGSRRKLDPYTKDYQRMLGRLSREGLDRAPGEAPGDFAARVERERPDLGESVRRITELYESVMYAGFDSLAPELKRQARRFSPF